MTTVHTYQPDQVLVVVPALNEARHIHACLRSLVDQDPFMAEVKIVVADGGSTDGTQDIIAQFKNEHNKVHLLNNPQQLQSAGVNAAVAHHATPTHKIVVRCDAHAVYPANYVHDIVRSFERQPNAASVATVMDARGDNCFQRAAAWVVDTPFGSGGSAHRGGASSGWVDHAHHAGFQLDWFQQIGGYDPSFSHNEDAEYDIRLGVAGGRVWLDADIRMDYQMRPTPMGLMRQYWRYGRGRARTVTKHKMRPRLRQLIPVINLLLITLCLGLGFAAPVLWLWPIAYFGALLAISAVAVVKLRSICGLCAGLALFIMHNAWAAGFLRQLAISRRKTRQLFRQRSRHI
ncbi:hypothetical protein TW80_13700 [Loktanella sp. S4079]|nr:hypothetical protein TW80_13700 [Loktanella sp. S4079]